MGVACPRCGQTAQVLRLSEYWMSLSQDAELKKRLAQPPEYAAVWWVPIGAAVVAALGFSSGAAGLGVAAVVVAVLAVAFMVVRTREAAHARDQWGRELYCRACPLRFLPEQGLLKA